MINGYEKRENYTIENGCPSVTHEEATVTVPVCVDAYAKYGNISLDCMGPPVITRNSSETPGRPGAISRFTVKQRMRMDIPIIFGMKCEVGEGHVLFDLCDKDDNDDCKCHDHPKRPEHCDKDETLWIERRR